MTRLTGRRLPPPGEGAAETRLGWLDAFLETPLARPELLNPNARATLLADLAATLEDGRTPTSALLALAEAHGETTLGRQCSSLAGVLARGKALSGALASFPDVFSSSEVALVRAGERVGQLRRGVLEAATVAQDRAASLRDRAWTQWVDALTVAAATLAVFALSLVLRPLLEAASPSGLPELTSVLLTGGRIAPALVGFAAALWMVRVLARRRTRTSAARRAREVRRAAHVLAWLLPCGLTAAEALTAAAEGCADRNVGTALTQAADAAAQGAALTSALAGDPTLATLAQVAATAPASAVPTALAALPASTAVLSGETPRRAPRFGGALLLAPVMVAVWLAAVLIPAYAAL